MAVSHRGAISFGMVHIPVGLYTATQDNDIHFNQLCKEDGSRVKYKKVCSGCGKEIGANDIVKGFEYEPGKYVYRFYTEKQPEGMEYKKWCHIRLTEKKVLSYLRNVLKKQNAKPPEDKITLVKRDYDLVYKGYSPKARLQMTDTMKTPIPIYQLASSDGDNGFIEYARLIRRKQKEYIIQNQRFENMAEDPAIAEWLNNFSLWDSENDEEIRLLGVVYDKAGDKRMQYIEVVNNFFRKKIL